METNDITDPAIRRTYLGGSEAAAALGVSPWESRVDLWMRKTGRAESPQLTSGPALWGTLLEEPVADYWAETTGRKIRRQPKAYQHDAHSFLRGHIDRMVIGESDGTKILEVKTTGHWSAADWGPGGSDEIPMWYRIQLAHYFACTGYRVAECVVLVGGQDCRFYTVQRDDELVASVVDGLAAFWQEHVVADVPPSAVSLDDVKKLHPREFAGGTVQADDDALVTIEILRALQATAKEVDAKIEAAKLALMQRIGDAEALLGADGKPLATWKTVERKGYTVAPNSFRQFSLKKAPK